MFPPSIQKLIDIFSKFPTVGPRTASRFVFYLLKLPEEEIKKIITSIEELKKEIKLCDFCFKPFEGKKELCEICENPNRDKSLLCVIEKETDIEAIEKTKYFKGRYFILGGTISPLKKTNISKLRIKELQKITENNAEIREIILGINPTTEGETTVLYLERLLEKNLPTGRQITRLGRGLPVGGEIEYADEETISSALEGRK